MRLLLLGGVAGPVLFALTVVVAAAMRPDYSHVHQFISELGATGSTNAAIMNYAGFVPAGLCVAGFGIALSRTLPLERLVLVCVALVVLFGAGIAISGFVSCDVGCPQNSGSLENAIHNRIAPAVFFGLIVAAGTLAVRFRNLEAWQGLAWPSAACAVLSLLLLGALASTLEARRMTGMWQRLLLLVLFSWCALISVHAYRVSNPRKQGVSRA
jgi:hypothetical membrane protein